ncbi:PAS domain-containing protein [bacterium SCSIO 12741]|nr:PAS domain-containing protein [bacterium SCSIO 12741]
MALSQLLLTESGDVFALLDKEFKWVEVSVSLERLWGHKPSSILGNSFLSLVHDADLKRVQESFLECQNQEGILELRIGTTSGEISWNRLSWKKLSGPRYLCTFKPIAPLTERELRIKLNEAALTDSEKIAKMGSWWVNVQTRENRWSNGNFALWGLPVSDKPPSVDWVFEQMDPKDSKRIRDAMEEVQRTGEQVELMFRIPHSKEGPRYIISRVRPWYIQGKLMEVKGVNFDVTDLVKANLELEKRNATLNRKNEQMRNYAFLNSHHVRGPLSSILGLIDLIRMEPQASMQYLQLIEQCAHELDEVINKINRELGEEDGARIISEKD